MRDYTKIEAWRLADDLTVSVYQHTRSFPKQEVYGLTSQMRRAAYSVPANIVEGALREANEADVCLSARLDPSGGERSWETEQIHCNCDQSDCD
jgi:hypothetical protein